MSDLKVWKTVEERDGFCFDLVVGWNMQMGGDGYVAFIISYARHMVVMCAKGSMITRCHGRRGVFCLVDNVVEKTKLCSLLWTFGAGTLVECRGDVYGCAILKWKANTLWYSLMVLRCLFLFV